jgi:hypothetical protein
LPNAGLIPVPTRVFCGLPPEKAVWVRVEHPSFSFSPLTGELYVLTLLDVTHEIGLDAVQQTLQYRRALIVSVFGPDLLLRRQAVLDGLRAEIDQNAPCSVTLTVLPTGKVALFSDTNRTWVYQPGFDERVIAYALDAKNQTSGEALGPILERNFATRATVAADGRLVCQLHGWHPTAPAGEIVAVSREPVTDLVVRPELDFLLRTKLRLQDGNTPYATETFSVPYLFVAGRPFPAVYPPPAEFIDTHLDWVWVHEALALSDGRFNLAARRMRSGNSVGGHAILIVDAAGDLQGHVAAVAPQPPHGMYDLDRTKGGDYYDVAVDRGRKWIVVKTRDALSVSSYDGVELKRVPLTEETGLEGLRDFVLRGGTPGGGVLLLHRKRHTFFEVLLSDQLDELAPRLRDGLASFETAVKPLQKRYPNAKFYRINPGPDVHFDVPSPESPALSTISWDRPRTGPL